jgi:hypothetical protein
MRPADSQRLDQMLSGLLGARSSGSGGELNEQELIAKLRLVEALVAGGASRGERSAAENARARIEERVRSLERDDPPREYQFTLRSPWSRRLFVALLRRYGLTPYRYHRQRSTTIMVRLLKGFCDEVLWPEFSSWIPSS